VTTAQYYHFSTGLLRVSQLPKPLSSFAWQEVQTCGPIMPSSLRPKCAILSGCRRKVWEIRPTPRIRHPFPTIGLTYGRNCNPGVKIVLHSSLNLTFLETTTTLLAHPFLLCYLLYHVQSPLINCITQRACCCWMLSRQVLIYLMQAPAAQAFGTLVEYVESLQVMSIMDASTTPYSRKFISLTMRLRYSTSSWS